MDNKKHSDRLHSRREALMLGATGALTLVGIGTMLEGIVHAQATSAIVSMPALEEGPYWIDETPLAFRRSDVRANTNGANVQPGIPLHLGLTVTQLVNGVITPLPNAFVYIWHCDATGLYSGEAVENTLNDNYLRGYQVSNSHGNVNFLTIYPGWYSGRTVHIHARVRLYANNDPAQAVHYDFETQLFFDPAVTSRIYQNVSPYSQRPNSDTPNNTDHVFTGASLDADGVTSNAGGLTTMRLADDSTYVMGTYRMILNLSLTESTGNSGGPPPNGGPPNGGPPNGGPPPGGNPPPGGPPPGG